jgi:hypothetical protein
LGLAFLGENPSCSLAVGGERDRVSLAVLAFLVPPQRAANAYLEPNRNSLQKTIGGRQEMTGGGVAIGAETRQTDVENAYLQPIWSLLAVRCRNL